MPGSGADRERYFTGPQSEAGRIPVKWLRNTWQRDWPAYWPQRVAAAESQRVDDTGQFEQQMIAALRDLQRWHMPFGKFGPEKFPPRGVPLYDLPYEYLAYFERRGYPRGRLGELMKFVHDIKRDGGEAMFDAFRRQAGGRTNLRRKGTRRS